MEDSAAHHRLEGRINAQMQHQPDGWFSRAVSHCAVIVTLAFLTRLPAQVGWRQVPPTPPGRDAASLHHLPGLGTNVMFGGHNSSSAPPPALSDTWTWNGTTWTALPAAGGPARSGHASSVDQSRGEIVLFGGSIAGAPIMADTLVFDGTAWQGRTPTTVPPGRYQHAMAHDSRRMRTVMFGGMGGTGALADLWEWNGSDWQSLAVTGGPGARSEHAMAFDPVARKILLHGGVNRSGWTTTYYSDTWHWDGAAWQLLTPTRSPGRRSGHRIVCDSIRNKVVMYGGVSTQTVQTDTWEWDGSTWAPATATGGPGYRTGHAMTFDSARARTILYGGNRTSDVWEYDGAAWSQRPPRPLSSAMAWDGITGGVLQFGGYNGGGPGPLYVADTWLWNGNAWQKLTLAMGPPGRYHHAMVTDTRRQRIIMLGGFQSWGPSNDMWEWDGSTWSSVATASAPPPRYGHGMAYDATRQMVTLFGGADSAGDRADTWEWSSVGWSQRSPASQPGARRQHGMAFDVTRLRTVLFGGYFGGGSRQDTWEWDGIDWRSQSPSTSPPAGAWPNMVHDPRLQGCVLLAPRPWLWSGATWSALPSVSPHPPDAGYSAHDPIRQVVVTLSGSETWVYGAVYSASVSQLGPGCPGSRGVPDLGPMGPSRPVLGSLFTMEIRNALTPGLVLGVMGVPGTHWGQHPLPAELGFLGMPGCYLYTDIQATGIVASQGGTYRWALAIPIAAQLAGMSMRAQALCGDPGVNVLGAITSNGLSLIVGSL